MILAYMFVLHFIADFLLQSREMGKNKSSNYTYLFKHLAIIFGIIFVGLVPFLGLKLAFVISFYNAVIHGVIDKNIWNLYKAFVIWKMKRDSFKWTWMNGNLNIPHEERAAKKLEEIQSEFKFYEDHWFYATIGFDQLLHALTIIALAGLLL